MSRSGYLGVGLLVLALAVGLLAWARYRDNPGGPGGASAPPDAPGEPADEDPPDDSSVRGKMVNWKPAGNFRALLAARLGPEGGKGLDIFFETADEDNPRPVAVAAEPLTAMVRTPEGEVKELRFACAPAGQRPEGEKPGTCSHFTAAAPWLRAEDRLYVVTRVRAGGRDVKVAWKGFTPVKYPYKAE